MFLQDLFENTGLLPLYQCASAGHAVNGFGSEVAFPDNLAVNRRFCEVTGEARVCFSGRLGI